MFAVKTRVLVRNVCHVRSFGLSMLALLTVAGCGGADAPDTSSNTAVSKSANSEPVTEDVPETVAAETETDTPEAAVPDASAASIDAKPAEPASPVTANATGSFFGTVVLEGDAPQLDALVKQGDESVKDKEVCGVAGVSNESLVVGDGNGIANVFVYLRRAPKGHKSDVPSETVVLDQKGCVFLPHVALIRAGQKVLVKSSDAVQHNVHTFPARNQGTNLLINPNDQTGLELTYDRSETDPLQVKCDIHAWMTSYHLVLDHPFMAVTDANGNFTIDGLPAGDYEFRVWHERGRLLEKAYKATVNGDDKPATLKYGLDRFSVTE
jgi:plastocyanin